MARKKRKNRERLRKNKYTQNITPANSSLFTTANTISDESTVSSQEMSELVEEDTEQLSRIEMDNTDTDFNQNRDAIQIEDSTELHEQDTVVSKRAERITQFLSAGVLVLIIAVLSNVTTVFSNVLGLYDRFSQKSPDASQEETVTRTFPDSTEPSGEEYLSVEANTIRFRIDDTTYTLYLDENNSVKETFIPSGNVKLYALFSTGSDKLPKLMISTTGDFAQGEKYEYSGNDEEVPLEITFQNEFGTYTTTKSQGKCSFIVLETLENEVEKTKHYRGEFSATVQNQASFGTVEIDSGTFDFTVRTELGKSDADSKSNPDMGIELSSETVPETEPPKNSNGSPESNPEKAKDSVQTSSLASVHPYVYLALGALLLAGLVGILFVVNKYKKEILTAISIIGTLGFLIYASISFFNDSNTNTSNVRPQEAFQEVFWLDFYDYYHLNEQIITEEARKNLARYSLSEVQYLCNEMIIRHGYIFSDRSRYEPFENKDWYCSLEWNPHLTIGDVENLFNEYERSNYDILGEVRNQKRKGEKKSLNLLNEDYILDKELISENDLDGYSYEQVRHIINGMYARHGYFFDDERFNEEFRDEPWYDIGLVNERKSMGEREIRDQFFNMYEVQNEKVLEGYRNKIK